MIFSYKKLEDLFDKINELGETKTFKSFSNQKEFLIRHDVDYDLKKAYELAELENKKGIVATFFVLPTTPFYNIMAKENQEILSSILKMGHEIGLHYDLSIDDTQHFFDLNIKILEIAVKQKIHSVSLHNPSVHGNFKEFKGYNNAYSFPFFNEKYYISDSCFDFRGKNIFDHIKLIKENSIQILLHPIHFSVKGEETYAVALNDLLLTKSKNMINLMSENREFKKELEKGIKVSDPMIFKEKGC